MRVKIKRVYEPPEPGDGTRILVDRLWPRGLGKDQAALDGWFQELAPTDALRKWFGHKPERWKSFQTRFRGELRKPGQQLLLRKLRSLAKQGSLTLLFASKDEEHNNAAVILSILKRNPPARRPTAHR